MNGLNISLMNGKRSGAGARARAEAGPKSRPEKSKIAELGLFKVSSPCVVAPVRVKSLFDLLEVTKLCGRFS